MRRLLVAAGLLGGALVGCTVSSSQEPGRRAALVKCGACHPVPAPRRLSPDAAERVLAAHGDRLPLDDETRATLLTYLGCR